jgi:fructuronate reductase
LAGWQTVADAIAAPELRAHIAALMDEVATTLTLPPSVNLPTYRDALLTRFANPALRHRTAQIAMDGSQKLPQRLLKALGERLEQGQPVERLTYAVALWLRHLSGRDDAGQPVPVNDQLADRLMPLATSDRPAAQVVERLLDVQAVFPAALGARAEFRGRLTDALERLRAVGTLAALDAVGR